ncbi:hypothetical protein P7K49_020190 [Saguinus oedipus]|uniref:Uncharacterized protein n=1 Tax=Saguinus oedipus TaxID=9490 RepID=A0ABQ9UZM1_SAGOE|nr:hypothetical protein P7K49_020190 [Saguinus oedipus]
MTKEEPNQEMEARPGQKMEARPGQKMEARPGQKMEARPGQKMEGHRLKSRGVSGFGWGMGAGSGWELVQDSAEMAPALGLPQCNKEEMRPVQWTKQKSLSPSGIAQATNTAK